MSEKSRTEEFAERAHRAIDDAQQKIEILQLKAKLAQAEGKQELESRRAELEKHKADLQAKLKTCQENSSEASSTFFEGCKESWARLSKAFEDASDALKRHE